jgi:hypothetical protein
VQGDNVTFQIASDADSQSTFTGYGVLYSLDPNQVSNPRPISNDFVFAISRDLGTIQATQDPVVWAIGYTIDPVINYSDLSGVPQTSHSPYYKIQYSNDEELASIYGNSQEDHMSNIKARSSTFSRISVMHPQELKFKTIKQNMMPHPSRICLKTRSLR